MSLQEQIAKLEQQLEQFRQELQQLFAEQTRQGGPERAHAELTERLQAVRDRIHEIQEQLRLLTLPTANQASSRVPDEPPPDPNTTSKLHDEISTITEPLLGRSPNAPTTDPVITSLYHVLAEAGPRQAEVMRRCAIPRWFDLNVLAVLREREDGNELILERLRAYSFVRSLGDGRYAYQDVVRETLLAEWQAQRPEELKTLNMRLAVHFGDRVRITTSGLPVSNAEQHSTISSRLSGQWDLWAREELYHVLMADPEKGFQRLRQTFEQFERNNRLADAEALLQLTRDVPLSTANRQVVSYLQARLARAALNLDEASAKLNTLIAQPNLDPLLTAEIRQTQGDICAESGQWLKATELYRTSLADFRSAGYQHQAAEVMLSLGDAYRSLGIGTGGWHIPAYTDYYPWLRRLGQFWHWLLALPFLITFALRGSLWRLPQPRYLAFYQNWMLIRLYRTAQDWYEQARRAFEELGDESGQLRAEQALAEIIHIFGDYDDALTRLTDLQKRPAARDPYVWLWLNCKRAAVMIDQKRLSEAQTILNEALPRFRELGDLRREAVVLELQAVAAVEAGNETAALEKYRSCLERFRTLHFTDARERTLYNLRVWRRQTSSLQLQRQIRALLLAEPEKRYVARFPRSLLLLLQILSVVAIPLTLLTWAIVLPDQSIRTIDGGQLIELLTTYNPWRALFVLVVLLALYSTIYTVIALALIFFIPLQALEREQPDYLITDPEGISRYDHRGALAQRIRWSEVRRWLSVDRRIWHRPLPLFSKTYLEANDGRDLLIDGITGWYLSLQEDIGDHLRQTENPISLEDRGFTLLQSRMAILVILGGPLLILFTAAEGGSANWLLRLLTPQLYTIAAIITYSGALMLIPIANWLGTKPLSLYRSIGLQDRWPYYAAALGIGAILLFFLNPSDGFQQSRALYVGLLFWGLYMLTESLVTLFAPKRRGLRLVSLAAALLIALLISFPRLSNIYFTTLSQSAARYAALQSTAGTAQPGPPVYNGLDQVINAGRVIAASPDYSMSQRAQALINEGKAYYAVGDYNKAIEAYTKAIRLYETMASSQERDEGLTVALVGRARAYKASQQDNNQMWDDLREACTYAPNVVPECQDLVRPQPQR
jgi:tetratricopeptide (TPR) repeat protein